MEAKVKTDKDSNAIRRVRPRIRVLIVDDHSVLRQALHLLLQSHDDLDVLGEVANGREAVAATEKLQPDVVLMDVVMPGLNGLDATRQIRKRCPRVRVLMLSGYEEDEQIIEALRAGASGYLNKESDISELLLAIQSVARGNTYFSASFSEWSGGGDFLLLRAGERSRGGVRPAHRPGARSAATDRRRAFQPIKRRGAGDQREDRGGAQGAHHEQAGRPQPPGFDPLREPVGEHRTGADAEPASG